MTNYIPKVGKTTIPETVKEKTVNVVLNQPEPGTPIRATLGDTVIVGTISKNVHPYAVINVDIKPLNKRAYSGFLEGHTLWVEDGWKFEILDGSVTVMSEMREEVLS